MRSLLPDSRADLSYDDLAALYEFPTTGDAGRPWVRANFVSTTDGAAQGPNFRSGTLSSAADQRIFALQRSLCDLILVGATTTRVEGYQPVRRAEVDADLRRRLGLAPVPTIAVVSRSLALDPALLAGGEAPTIVVTCGSVAADALAATRAQVPVMVSGDDSVDLRAALGELSRLGHGRVLCEGGPALMSQVVAAGSLDDLCLTVAPILVDGDRRRIMHGPDLVPARRLRLSHLLEEGDDLFARYLVQQPDQADPAQPGVPSALSTSARS